MIEHTCARRVFEQLENGKRVDSYIEYVIIYFENGAMVEWLCRTCLYMSQEWGDNGKCDNLYQNLGSQYFVLSKIYELGVALLAGQLCQLILFLILLAAQKRSRGHQELVGEISN